jgi:hypothetical protein
MDVFLAFVHQKYLFVRETWVQFGQGDNDAVAICGLPQQTRRQPFSSEGFAKRYSGLLKYFCISATGTPLKLAVPSGPFTLTVV